MTPVKNQNCGDCWANAGVAALEAAWAKAGNPKIVLSRQEVIDCFSCWPDCHGHSIQSSCGGGGMYVLILKVVSQYKNFTSAYFYSKACFISGQHSLFPVDRPVCLHVDIFN